MLVSVFPSVGLLLVFGLYIAALRTNNEGLKRTCLGAFGLLGILAIPTYFSGAGSMAALVDDARISQANAYSHQMWSYAALAALVLTGAAAWLELWRFGPPADCPRRR